MSNTTQKNFRLNEHYVELLATLSERFGVTESALVRRALDELARAVIETQRAVEEGDFTRIPWREDWPAPTRSSKEAA